MADEDPANVFAFPDFNQSSKWLTLSQVSGSQFFNTDLGASTKSTEGHISARHAKTATDGFFKLPADLVPINPIIEKETTHQDNTVNEPLHNVGLGDLDIFDDFYLQKDEPASAEAEYKTWDSFFMPDEPQPAPLFITEAGTGAYDTALKQIDDPLGIGNTKNPTVQAGPYLAALTGLAFGRGSILFTWDEEKKSFIPRIHEMRIPGYSTDVLRGIQQHCLECGSVTRFLSSYVQTTYKTHRGAVRVAVAKAVDVILLAIQKILGAKAKGIRTLLQLQSVVHPIRSVLVYFKSLIVKISKLETDEKTLSLIFEETQALGHGNTLLSEVMREVLFRVSEPWTRFVEKWIGLKDEDGIPLTKENPGNVFVKVEKISVVDDSGFETGELDYVLNDDRMPVFVPSETALTMFETGKTLRLLRSYHPEHLLCRTGLVVSSEPPPLQWHFDWESIGQFREDSKGFEKRLLQVLQRQPDADTSRPSTDPTPETMGDYFRLQCFGHGEVELEERFIASIEALSKPPVSGSEDDNLSKLLYDRLLEDTSVTKEITSDSSPHWSLIPYHSFGPLIAAQSQIINREYMRLLFTAHRLRDHFHLQKQFHLLGNGMFCSRLSHALFDPNLDTAERQAGMALSGGVMGLRLDGRRTWPPASSELRLALMGILTESYLPSPEETDRPAEENHDAKHSIASNISFGVRDLSPEEIDKCLDPGSLEALDFLRLTYKPPAPLVPVFTPVILLKYDKIFRLLLRILRMLYVIEQLFQDTLSRTSRWHHIDNASLRFRYEAQHFVSSLTAYFFDTGIEMPWRRFEAWVEGVEAQLTKSDSESEEARVLSLDELREGHERMLDHVMHSLLLRKRQQPVMKLLEDIFAVILQFSKAARLEALGNQGSEAQAKPGNLYNTFKKKVDVFITVCRGLTEKGGHSGKSNRNELMTDDGRLGENVKEENTLDRLLIKLEMSGHFGRSGH